jgi:hypothetical protein
MATLYQHPRSPVNFDPPLSDPRDPAVRAEVDLCIACGATTAAHFGKDGRWISCETLMAPSVADALDAQRSQRIDAIADLLALIDWRDCYQRDAMLPLTTQERALYRPAAEQAAGLANDTRRLVAYARAERYIVDGWEDLMWALASVDCTREVREQKLRAFAGEIIGAFRAGLTERNDG